MDDLSFIDLVKLYKILVKLRLENIFKNKDIKDDLRELKKIYEKDEEELLNIVDKIIIAIISHTRFSNIFIKYYANIIKDNFKVNDKISVWEFIKVAGKSKNNDLSLERVEVDKGFVNIKEIKDLYKYELARIKIKELIEKAKKVELPESEEINEILEFINDLLKNSYKFLEGVKAERVNNIPIDWHPPCIRGILNDILSGGSPSHYARRSFVVYWFASKFNPNLRPLNKEGNLVNLSAKDIASEEEIEKFIDEMIEIFKNVEDFDEEKTRYYIMHNIGYKVGHQRFTHCEYCKNWKDDKGKGLAQYCNPDDICRKKFVIHPLDYLCYNINKHLKRRDK
ncbi:hypothetical protein [Methanocaldococcus sp.]